MSRTRASFLLGAALLALAAPGCLSRRPPEKQKFAFEVERPGGASVSAASAAGAAQGDRTLRVAHVRVSPLFERKGFVYRDARGRFDRDFYHEFFAPPGVLVRRSTARWLAASGIFSAVLEEADGTAADWLLQARVTDLYGDFRDPDAAQAVLAVDFALRNARSPRQEVVFQKSYASRLPADDDPEAVFAAWREGLARILTDLETDLRGRFSTVASD